MQLALSEPGRPGRTVWVIYGSEDCDDVQEWLLTADDGRPI